MLSRKLAFVLALLFLLLMLLRQGNVWAWPAQAPLRQTVPSRTPTKPPSATSASPTASAVAPTATATYVSPTTLPTNPPQTPSSPATSSGPPPTEPPSATPSPIPKPTTSSTATPIPSALSTPTRTLPAPSGSPTPTAQATYSPTATPQITSPSPTATPAPRQVVIPITPPTQLATRTLAAAKASPKADTATLMPHLSAPASTTPWPQPLASLATEPATLVITSRAKDGADATGIDYGPFLGIGAALALLVSGMAVMLWHRSERR